MNDLLIQAAAELSGRPADSLTLPEALQILYDDGEERGDLCNQIEARAAATFFDDPARAQQWELETDDELMKDTPALQALVRRDLGKEIRHTGRRLLHARQAAIQGEPYTEEQLQEITQAGLILTGNQLPTDAAANVLREIRPEDLEKLFLPLKVDMPPELQEMIRHTMEPLQEIAAQIAKKHEALSKVILSFDGYRETLEKLQEAVKQFINTPAGQLVAEISGDLEPYIDAELQNPKYNGAGISELFDAAERDDDGQILESSLLMQAVNAAREAKKKAEATPTAVIKSTDKIDFPLDKINNNAWKLLAIADKNGQLAIDFDMSGHGRRKRGDATVVYSINFDALTDIKISKALTVSDKRVYMAISALFNAGNDVITIAQIYKHTGGRGKCGAHDAEKIHKSIVKMLGAQIVLDNSLEAQAYKGYSKFVYRGSLLPVEIGELYNIQGALTKAAIHILREPPLMTFARQRNQITTINLSLLQSPVNKTEQNMQIDDYLQWRISRAKDKVKRGKNHADHGSEPILLTTLYKESGIAGKPTTDAEKKAKKRAPETIRRYLEYYQKDGFISSYTMEKDRVIVKW